MLGSSSSTTEPSSLKHCEAIYVPSPNMLRAGQMRLLASMIGLFAMIALGSDASLDVSGDHSAGRWSSTIAPDVAPAPQIQPKSPPSLRPAMLGKVIKLTPS